MLIITLSALGTQANLGVVGCDEITSVSTYHWASIDEDTVTTRASLQGYSRWTEPAAGLVARLLCMVPNDHLAWPLLAKFRCDISMAGRRGPGRLLESLEVSLKAGVLRVAFRDEYRQLRREGQARARYDRLTDLLVHAIRLALWGADAEPCIPPPLTSVPVHTDDAGTRYVLEEEIPEHPRAHFVARHSGGTQPYFGAFYAWDWEGFIGATPK
jgi:hypothetical protein